MERMTAAVAAALIVSALVLLLRRSNPEIALVLGAAGAAALFLAALPALSEITDFFEDILPSGAAAEVFPPLMRVAGIAVLSRMGAELCRDAAEGAMAVKLELLGGVLAFAAAMPVFRLLAELLGAMGA